MSSAMVQVVPEWAVWGKDPGERDFQLLRYGGRRLGAHDFSEIISRYSPGTHTDLPQVTLSWTRLADEIYLGIAIQEWSNEDDRLGRDIAVTRYFGIPYFRLDHPVSYVGLYEALATHDAAHGGEVSVPELDPHRIAEHVSPGALGTAALLLTRSPVQLEGAEGVPMLQRLCFLDAVAALLPYPMRTRLSAATWVSSTSEHNFRLAFSSHVRDGAHPAAWGRAPTLPPGEQLAHRYLELLVGQSDFSHVVRELARIDKPMGFGSVDVMAALHRLQDVVGSPAQRPAPLVSTGTDPADVLRDYAEARRGGHREAVEQCIDRLEHLRTRPYDDDQRSRHRRIVQEHRLLETWDALSPPRQLQLHQALLQMAYASVLNASHLEQIEADAGMLHAPLLQALETFHCTDTMVSLLIAVRSGDGGRRRILSRIDTDALISAAGQSSAGASILDMVFHEQIRRLNEDEEPVTNTLWLHAYLSHPLVRRFPGDVRSQFDWLRRLLTAAYGPQLGMKEFEEVVDGRRTPAPTPALFAAALSLYGTAPGAGEALFAAFFGRMLDPTTLGPEIAAHVRAVLDGPSADDRHLRPPPPSHRAARPRAAQRLARLFPGRGVGRASRREASGPVPEQSPPQSFGWVPAPDDRPGAAPDTDFDARFTGENPWLGMLTVLIIVASLTLLLLFWMRPGAPPP